MAAGPEEWQVVTALKEAKSPGEICGMLELGDFSGKEHPTKLPHRNRSTQGWVWSAVFGLPSN